MLQQTAFTLALVFIGSFLLSPHATKQFVVQIFHRIQQRSYAIKQHMRHRIFARWKREIVRPFAWRMLDRSVEIIADNRANGAGSNGPVLVSLLKDGQDFLPTFLDHYRRLGFTEFVFLDNGSSDQTCQILSREKDVLVLRSTLSFKHFYHSMQTWLIERYAAGRWTLLADIDEYFDFPYSEEIGINGLIAYLKANRFTAVMTYMLDMYPERITKENEDDDWFETHRYFETKSLYWGNVPQHIHGVVPPNLKIVVSGVRQRMFDVFELLSKSTFFDASQCKVTVKDTHFALHGHLADVTGYFRHYRFKPPFFDTIAHIANSKHYYLGSGTYCQLHDGIKNEDQIVFYDEAYSVPLEHSRSVHEAGGGAMSDAYLNFVATWRSNHEEKPEHILYDIAAE